MAETTKLDRLDRLLLAELDAEANQPLRRIAKTLRLGSDLVHYRMQRLQREKVFLRTGAIVDHYRAGKTLYKIYLRLENHLELVARLEKHLNRKLQLHWFARTYGRWDVIFSFYADTPQEASRALVSSLEPYASQVLETAVLTVTQRIRYSNTFGQRRKKVATTIGDDPGHLEIDPLEKQLLVILERDARAPTVQIARELKSTPAIVDYRIKKLEENRLIRGYRLHINHSALGLMLYKLCLRLRDYQQATLDRIEQFAEKHPNAVCIIYQLGEWLLELEIEVRDTDELNLTIDALRSELAESLQSIDYLLIRDCYYLNRVE